MGTREAICLMNLMSQRDRRTNHVMSFYATQSHYKFGDENLELRNCNQQWDLSFPLSPFLLH